jgi:hypothetical protein
VAFDWLALVLLIGWDGATLRCGLMHLLIDAWYVVFAQIGLKQILIVPLWDASNLVALCHEVGFSDTWRRTTMSREV